MAEVVGLVMGGVSLTTLVGQCMSIFHHIDSGRNFSEDYQRTVLQITLLGRRLKGWEEEYLTRKDKYSKEDIKLAENAVAKIKRCLEEGFTTSERYNKEAQSSGEKDVVACLTERVIQLEEARDGKTITKTSLRAKVRWVFLHQARMDDVIRDIASSLTYLEGLNGQLSRAVMASRSKADAEAVLQLQVDHESIGAAEAIEELSKAAEKTDPEFKSAIDRVGQSHNKIKIGKNSRVEHGHYVAQGFSAQIPVFQNTYDDIDIGEGSRVRRGNNYGGKSVFDD